MTISASQVKELRERTGAGMMECKKALETAGGDIEAAIEAMRKSGMAKAAKKAGRVTAEGIIEIKVSVDGLWAAMVEINCETDFVARDSSFKTFASEVAECALQNKCADVDALYNAVLKTQESATVEEVRQGLINRLGENVQIRRVALLNAKGIIGSYTHGGRIGAIVALDNSDGNLAKDLAMHIAAANPLTIDPKEVPAELIAKEKEIFLAQSADSGKPADIVEKMVAGRISKFLNEVSLMGQPFVKDPGKSIANLLKENKATVTGFTRYEVGEGIEKQVEDFAQAVKAQISGGT